MASAGDSVSKNQHAQARARHAKTARSGAAGVQFYSAPFFTKF